MTTQAALLNLGGTLSPSQQGEVVIKLNPPELGLLRISLVVSETGQLAASLTAERAETEAMLRRHATDLSTALGDAGYAGVDLSFGQFSDRGEDTAENAPPGAPHDPAHPDGTGAATPHVAVATGQAAPGTLDLRL